MAIWLQRLWEALLSYDLLTIPGAVEYLSENTLAQEAKNSGERLQPVRGKKKPAETGWYYNNARQLGLKAQALKQANGSPVMAVLFRDADGTRTAPGQLWKTKWDSMLSGFKAAEFDFGVPMLPKPKSEAWLLCITQEGNHSHEALEDISGNDDSPNSAKAQLAQALGRHHSAAELADWCTGQPTSWTQLMTMPSFKAFYERFHAVADAILRRAAAAQA